MSSNLASLKEDITNPKIQKKSHFLARKFGGNKLIIIGSIMIICYIALAVLGPLFIPYSPYETDYTAAHVAPNKDHFFGTDNLGRDVFSRVVTGTKEALTSGIIIVAIALLIGVPLGLISGFCGGWVDQIIMRIVDTGLAFPGLVLAMAISWILGPSFINTVLAVSVIMAPQFVRIMRGQVIVLKDREYILAAKSQGVPAWRIMLFHILRNSSTPLIVSGNLNIGYSIMTVASLAFLGLGTPPPFPSWGEMLQSGTQFLTLSPWISFFPGLFIFLLVLAFTMLGEGIRDILDPQSNN